MKYNPENHLKSTLKRYQLFGWDYDKNNPLNEQEINWYREYAGKTGGPVLELACGTGRLLIKLAESGFEVDGIDLSSKMLEIAQRRVKNLPAAVRTRISLICGDMTNYNLQKQYGLIFITDNSFRELETKSAQLSFLKSAHRHLLPEGLFLLSAKRFAGSDFLNDKRETPWSQPLEDPATGSMVSRKVHFNLGDDKKQLKGAYIYKTIDSSGREKNEECFFTSPIMHEKDYFSLFVEAGFSATVFADFVEQVPRKDSKILCFVCKK